MSSYEHFDTFIRPSDEPYTPRDVYAYVREIMLVKGIQDASTGRTYASWSSDIGSTHILDRSAPDIITPPRYQLEINDSRPSGKRVIYLLDTDPVTIAAYNDDGVAVAIDDYEDIMRHLCTNRFETDATDSISHIEEPTLNHAGDMTFRTIAARMAIESAVEHKTIDALWLARQLQTNYNPAVLKNVAARACSTILHEGACLEDDQLYPYTQSHLCVQQELYDTLSRIIATQRKESRQKNN